MSIVEVSASQDEMVSFEREAPPGIGDTFIISASGQPTPHKRRDEPATDLGVDTSPDPVEAAITGVVFQRLEDAIANHPKKEELLRVFESLSQVVGTRVFQLLDDDLSKYTMRDIIRISGSVIERAIAEEVATLQEEVALEAKALLTA